MDIVRMAIRHLYLELDADGHTKQTTRDRLVVALEQAPNEIGALLNGEIQALARLYDQLYVNGEPNLEQVRDRSATTDRETAALDAILAKLDQYEGEVDEERPLELLEEDLEAGKELCRTDGIKASLKGACWAAIGKEWKLYLVSDSVGAAEIQHKCRRQGQLDSAQVIPIPTTAPLAQFIVQNASDLMRTGSTGTTIGNVRYSQIKIYSRQELS